MGYPEELAYKESVRAIELQARSLDEVRTRAGVLLAASAVASSFLGAEALRSPSVGIVVGLALVAFVVVLGLCIAVIVPRSDWRFALGANVLVEDWAGENPCGDYPAMLAFVARKIEENWAANKSRMDGMLLHLQVATAALGVEVILWTVELAQRG